MPENEKKREKKSGDGEKRKFLRQGQPGDKKTKYLRLGYTQNPRKSLLGNPPKLKTEKPDKTSECSGEKHHCKKRKTGANIISSDTLLGKERHGAKDIAPLFAGIIPDGRCCGKGGPDCCGCGEG